jgi:hypothetical protein
MAAQPTTDCESDGASDADMETGMDAGGAAPKLLQFGPNLPPLPPVATPLAASERKRKN